MKKLKEIAETIREAEAKPGSNAMDTARAVIASLRRLDAGLVYEGLRFVGHHSPEQGGKLQDVHRAWQAIIDKILEE